MTVVTTEVLSLEVLSEQGLSEARQGGPGIPGEGLAGCAGHGRDTKHTGPEVGA